MELPWNILAKWKTGKYLSSKRFAPCQRLYSKRTYDAVRRFKNSKRERNPLSYKKGIWENWKIIGKQILISSLVYVQVTENNAYVAILDCSQVA